MANPLFIKGLNNPDNFDPRTVARTSVFSVESLRERSEQDLRDFLTLPFQNDDSGYLLEANIREALNPRPLATPASRKPLLSKEETAEQLEVSISNPDSDLFAAGTEIINIPLSPVKSFVLENSRAVGNFIISALGIEPSGNTNEDLFQLQEDDKGRQIEKNAEAARVALENPTLPPDERLDKAKEEVAKEPVVRPVGEIYAEKAYEQDLAKNGRALFAKEVEFAAANQENKDNQVKLILDREDVSYDDFLESSWEFLTPLMEGLIESGRLNPEFQAYLNEEVTGKPLSDKPNYTTQEFLDFISPWGDEAPDSMDTDWAELWGELDVSEGEFISARFKVNMEDKYGPEWKLRFLGMAVKEMGVDLALVAAAYIFPPVAAAMFPTKAASLALRFRGVLSRMVLFGLGGGAVHSAVNAQLGRDDNFLAEVGLRAGGSLAADAVIKTLGKVLLEPGIGLLKAIGRTTEQLAAKAALPIRTKQMIQKLWDSTETTQSFAAAVLKASLVADIREYNRLMSQLAKGVTEGTAETKILLRNVSELTGIPEDQLAVRLATDNHIFPEPVLKEVPTLRGFQIERSLEKNEALVAKLQKALERNISQKDRGLLEKKLRNTNNKIGQLRLERIGEVNYTTGNLQADELLGTKSSKFISQAVGFRLMGAEIEKQKQVQDLFTVYFSRDAYDFRDPSLFTSSVSKIAGRIIQPFKKATGTQEATDYAVPSFALNLFDAINRSNKYSDGFKKMLDAAGGMGKGKVLRALEKGSDEGLLYTPEELMGQGLLKNDIDSYYATRKVLDFAHMLFDFSLVKGMKRHVLKGTDIKRYQKFRGEVVEVLSKGLDEKKGVATIKFSKRSGTDVERREVVKIAELNSLDSVLPFHTGYLPISYKNAKFHVSEINLKTGAVSRLQVHPTRQGAIVAGRKLQEKAGTGAVIAYNSWSAPGEVGQVGFFRGARQLFDIVDEDTSRLIAENLKNTGISESQIKVYLDLMSSESLRQAHVGRRAAERLTTTGGKTADLLATEQAVADYLQTVSKRVGFGEWRQFTVDQFKERFKSVLRSDLPWNDPKAIVADTTFLQRADKQRILAGEAKQMQGWLHNMVTSRTRHEIYFDNMYASMDEKLATSSNIAIRALNKVMGNLNSSFAGVVTRPISTIFRPFGTEFNNLFRGLGSVPKLMFFNVAQVLVQGSQILATIGTRPVHASGAMKDTLLVTGKFFMEQAESTVGKRVVSSFDGEASRLLTLLRRSGYIADVGTTDLMSSIQSGSVPILSSSVDATRRILEFPFRLGEKTNRVMAFFTSRRELIDRFAKGNLKGLDQKTFKGTIDDDEFIAIVANRAKITALNMGKAGQLRSLSGVGSVFFQFKQVLPKFLHIFETKELTGLQKLGAAATMFGFWGPNAVPLMGDLFAFGDWAVSLAMGGRPTQREFFTQIARDNKAMILDYAQNVSLDDTQSMGFDRKFWDRMLSKGALNALTDGEWDIVNRVALGRFVADSFNMTQNPTDVVVSISVLHDMLDGAVNVASNVHIPSYIELMYLTRSPDEFKDKFELIFDRTPKSMALLLAKETGHAISYVGALGRFFNNVDGDFHGYNFDRRNQDTDFKALDPNERNFFRTSYGTTTGVQVNTDRLEQLLLGITPGKLVEEFESKNIERMYLKSLNDYRQSQFEKYDIAGRREKAHIIQETLAELEGFRALLTSMQLNNIVPANFYRTTVEGFINRLIRKNTPQPSALRRP